MKHIKETETIFGEICCIFHAGKIWANFIKIITFLSKLWRKF